MLWGKYWQAGEWNLFTNFSTCSLFTVNRLWMRKPLLLHSTYWTRSIGNPPVAASVAGFMTSFRDRCWWPHTVLMNFVIVWWRWDKCVTDWILSCNANFNRVTSSGFFASFASCPHDTRSFCYSSDGNNSQLCTYNRTMYFILSSALSSIFPRYP